MRRTRGRSGDALRAAALAGVLLAGCCPAPAGPQGAAADGVALPAGTPAPGAVARLTVRTAAGPAAAQSRLARTGQGDVVRLVPAEGIVLPADAELDVVGRWGRDGTLHVSAASPPRAGASAPRP